MIFFISYDIGDNRLRLRLAKLLLAAGCQRVQKSVFIALGFSPAERAVLQGKVKKLLSGRSRQTDSVLYIPVEKNHRDDLLLEGDSVAWQAIMEKMLLLYI